MSTTSRPRFRKRLRNVVAVMTILLGMASPGFSQSIKEYIRMGGKLIAVDSRNIGAPSPPGSLIGVAINSYSASLIWTPATDGGGVEITGYRVYRNGGQISVVSPAPPLFLIDVGLDPETHYLYSVRTENAVGLLSAPVIVDVLTPPLTLGPPTQLVAEAVSSGQVNLTWSASPDNSVVHHYEIERMHHNGTVDTFNTPNNAVFSYADTAVTPGVTYVYRVRAVDGASHMSEYTNRDLATTIMFTDGGQLTGVVIHAHHMTELRQAVDAVRVAAGQSAVSWTDPELPPQSVIVKAIHIQELRDNLAEARGTLGISTGAYTDPTLQPQVTIIQAEHFEELRQNVR